MQLLNCPVLWHIVLQQHCHLERWGLQRVPATLMLHDYFVSTADSLALNIQRSMSQINECAWRFNDHKMM
jgi:hypothetical protein